MIESTFPVKVDRTTTPKIITKITIILSIELLPEISPYPTVEIVVTMK